MWSDFSVQALIRPRLCALGLVCLVVPHLAAQNPTPQEWEKYGDGVSVSQATSITAILASPADFDGKVVAVEGRIVGVCQMAGCWIALQGEDRGRIRVKVEDGVIVFPATAYGRRAVAQGRVEHRTLDRDEYLAQQRHQAEEQGVEFREEDLGSPPYRTIRLLGTGALIEPANQ